MQLDEREYNVLAALSAQQPQLQTNYYFCSENFSPEEMVRIRQKNGCFLLGYKHRLQQQSGVTVCDERECEISADYAQSLCRRGIRAEEINGLLKTQMEEHLHFVGKMQTYRTTFCLNDWRLELDDSRYLGRRDFELECESSQIQQLAELQSYLSFQHGIVIKYSTPKSQRFFEALNEKL